MVIKQIELKIWENNHITIYANQGEVDSRYIEVAFRTQEQTNLNLSNRTVTFYALKPDGTKIYNTCTVDSEKNTATTLLTSQVLSSLGEIECEFQIFDGENLLLKVNGVKIIVSDELNFSEAIESTSEFNTLTEAINKADNFSKSIGDISKLTTTEKTTIVDALNEIDSDINKANTSITQIDSSIAEINAKIDSINSSISTLNSKVIPISQGGTEATTAKVAMQKLGIADTATRDFSADSTDAYIEKVLAHFDSNMKQGVPYFMHAGHAGWHTGGAFGWQISSSIKFVVIISGHAGVKFYFKYNGNWTKASAN